MTTDSEDRVRGLLAGAAARVRSTPPDPAQIRAGVAPVRRPGPRRWLAVVAAAVAVAAIASGIVLSSRDTGHSRAAARTTTSTASLSSTASLPGHLPPPIRMDSPIRVSSGSAGSGQPSACVGAQLRASVIESASIASQPYLIVGLTNAGASACVLRGYPTLTMSTLQPATKGPVRPPLAIRVQHGAYVRGDNGPVTVLLLPGRAASFVIETQAAYNGGANPVYIRQISITVPGGGQPIPVPLRADAPLVSTAPGGNPIPVELTAFVPVLSANMVTMGPRQPQ